MGWLDKQENGYRVVWDVGWWLDYERADDALDFYLGIREVPALQEDIRRPRIFRIENGELRFEPVSPTTEADES